LADDGTVDQLLEYRYHQNHDFRPELPGALELTTRLAG
jgi:hypothetical protein